MLQELFLPLTVKICSPSLGEKVKKSSLICSFSLSQTFFCPFFLPDGSRQAGSALYVGRTNKWCILDFLTCIRRTLCFSAQKDYQFMEKANFSQRTNVGPEQNQLFFHLSHNPLLSESLSLPDSFLSLLNIGFSHYSPECLCRALPVSCYGPGVLSKWAVPLVIRKKKVQCLEASTWAE